MRVDRRLSTRIRTLLSGSSGGGACADIVTLRVTVFAMPSYHGPMGAFAEMFPGRKLGREARDEDSSGQGRGPRLPDGPLDLDSGVVQVEPSATESELTAERDDHDS